MQTAYMKRPVLSTCLLIEPEKVLKNAKINKAFWELDGVLLR